MLRAALLVIRPSMEDRRVAALNFWVVDRRVDRVRRDRVDPLETRRGWTDSLSQAPLALLLLSVVLLVSARQEMEPDEITSGRGTEQRGDLAADRPDHTDFRASFPGRFRVGVGGADRGGAMSVRRKSKPRKRQLVDGILSRLHAHGMDSLTAEERALLQRVSARYRTGWADRT